MNLGKTIQIFIPDGNPRGIRIAEITSRTVQVILIPRPNLTQAATRNEISSGGVYFRSGNPDERIKPLLYVGEAEDCLTRLKQHNKSKEFWEFALVGVSRTPYTKTHAKFLEWLCLNSAQTADRYHLENNNNPNRPYVPESVESDISDNFETIKILVSTLGFPVFDEIKKPTSKETLLCKGKSASAKGAYTEEGMVVFKGSTANMDVMAGESDSTKKLRQKLRNEGILIQGGKVYKFAEDFIFSSPSAAALNGNTRTAEH